MVFCPTDKVDEVWRKIAEALVAGKLGNAAKVSTVNPGQRSHVICVYVKNFRDEADVERVLRGLLTVADVRGGFKPDFMTYLGVYKDPAQCAHPNLAKIKPTIYPDMLSRVKKELKRLGGCDDSSAGDIPSRKRCAASL